MKFGNYEIVKYCPEFKNQILELLRYHLSDNLDLNAEYLNWKYDHNPYLDSPLIYFVLWAGQLVGMMGAYGAKWRLGDPCQTFLGPCLGDAVIHPDHRNPGLYQKMTAFALDDLARSGFPYVFDLSARPEIALSMMMNGWRSLGFFQTAQWRRNRQAKPSRWRSYARQLPWLAASSRRIRNYARQLSSSQSDQRRPVFDSLDSHEVQGNSRAKSHISVEKNPRAIEMAALIQQTETDGRLQHVRNEQFFAWRFQNPLAQYRFIFWDDDCLQGYLVLQSSRWSGGGANIVDWEAASGQVLLDLLQAAIRLSKLNGLNIWSVTLPNDEKRELEEIGFRLVDKSGSITRDINRPTVLVKSLAPETPPSDWVLANRRLLDVGNWDLRMIYSDNY